MILGRLARSALHTGKAGVYDSGKTTRSAESLDAWCMSEMPFCVVFWAENLMGENVTCGCENTRSHYGMFEEMPDKKKIRRWSADGCNVPSKRLH